MSTMLKMEKRVVAAVLTLVMILGLFSGMRLTVQAAPESANVEIVTTLNATPVQGDAVLGAYVPADPVPDTTKNPLWDDSQPAYVETATGETVYEDKSGDPDYTRKTAVNLENEVQNPDDGFVYYKKTEPDDHEVLNGDGFIYPQATTVSDEATQMTASDGYVYYKSTADPASDDNAHLKDADGYLREKVTGDPAEGQIKGSDDYLYEIKTTATEEGEQEIGGYVFTTAYSATLNGAEVAAENIDAANGTVAYGGVAFAAAFPSTEGITPSNLTKSETTNIALSLDETAFSASVKNPFYGDKVDSFSADPVTANYGTVEYFYTGDLITVSKNTETGKVDIASSRVIGKEEADTLTATITASVTIGEIEISKDINITVSKENTAPVVSGPVVTFKDSEDAASQAHTEDGTEYFDKELTYTFAISDKTLNTGATTATYTYCDLTAEDPTAEITEKATKETQSDGTQKVSFDVRDGWKLVGYSVTAEDLAGNVNNDKKDVELSKPQVVDTTAPAVKVNVTGENLKTTGGIFARTDSSSIFVAFNEAATGNSGEKAGQDAAQDVKVTVTVTDRNIKAGDTADGFHIKNNTDGWTATPAAGSITFEKTISVNPDETKTLEIDFDVADLAGNKAGAVTSDSEIIQAKLSVSEGKITGTVVADRTRPNGTDTETDTPVITLNPEPAEGVEAKKTLEDGRILYNGSLSYKATVYDPGTNYSGLGSVHWSVTNIEGISTDATPSKTYTGEKSDNTLAFAVNAAEGVENNNLDLTVSAADLAGNETIKIQPLAIDTKAPRISAPTVKDSAGADAAPAYTDPDTGIEYFGRTITYSFQIEDLNLDTTKTKATYTYCDLTAEDPTAEITENATITTPSPEDGTQTVTFTVQNGWKLVGYSVTAEDLAGNVSSETNSALKQVVDNTAPAVKVNVTGENLKTTGGIFARTGSDLIFVAFNETATGNSGEKAAQTAAQDVKVTVTVTDWNIETGDAADGFHIKNNTSGWTVTPSAGSIIFEKTISVNPDETKTLEIDFDVADLAGNKAGAVTSDDGTVQTKLSVTEGKITGTVVADRTRPNSADAETDTPVITLNPTPATGKATLTDGRTLYNGSVSYKTTIYDPGANYSGLESVEWSVTGKAGISTDATPSKTYTGEKNDTLDLAVNAAADIEYDDLDLTVHATDLAGNVTTKIQPLAIDTKKPVIDPPVITPAAPVNTKDGVEYYDAKLTYSFEISDLNLDPDKTTVSFTYDNLKEGKENQTVTNADGTEYITLGAVSTGEDGKLHQTVSFTIQDDWMLTGYTVSATDLAENTGSSNDTGLKKVVDLTAPTTRINVTGDGIKTDGYFSRDGIVYLLFKTDLAANAESGKNAAQAAQDVTVTVTVTDVNIALGTNKDFYVMNNDPEGWTPTTAKGSITFEKTFSVKPDTTEAIKLDFNIADLAGHKLTGAGLSSNVGAVQANTTVTEGQVLGWIAADRERPSSLGDETQTPVITLIPNDAEKATLADGRLLYANSMSYSLNVFDPVFTDKDGHQVYSGLQSVSWTVTSDQEGLIVTSGNTHTYNTPGTQKDSYTVPVTITKTGETDLITLTVTAVDFAGNTTTKIQYLAMDNQRPSISKPTVTPNKPVNTKDGVDYYDSKLKYSFEISDLNLDPALTTVQFTYVDIVSNEVKTEEYSAAKKSSYIKVSGAETKEGKLHQTVSFEIQDGWKLTGYAVSATDLAENKNSRSDTKLAKVVDMTAPTFEINVNTEDWKNTVTEYVVDPETGKTTDEISLVSEYYDNALTFEVKIYDLNFDLDSCKEITFNTKAGTGTKLSDKVKTLTLKKASTSVTDFNYTGKITLGDYDVEKGAAYQFIMDALQGLVKDLAENKVQEAAGSFGDHITIGQESGKSNGKLSLIEKRRIVVDLVNPEILLTTPENKASNVQEEQQAWYFNKAQTVTVQVTDINLDLAKKKSWISYVTAVNGAETTNTVSFSSLAYSEGVYSLVIPVEDGTLLKDLQLQATDLSKRLSSAEDKNKNQTIFKTYVVDATNPAVAIDLSGDGIERAFLRDGEVYVQFKTPAVAESGVKAGQRKETITYTVTVQDRNVLVDDGETDLGYKNAYYVTNLLEEDTAEWKTKGKGINKDKTLTYTKSLTVAPDDSGSLRFNLRVIDLAGNAPTNDNLTVTGAISAQDYWGKLYKASAKNGKQTKIIGPLRVDRERPSSVNDEKTTPVIIMTPNTKEIDTLADGTLLYNNSMSYTLNVYDPADTAEDGRKVYSGLKEVSWTVSSDVDGLIATSNNLHTYSEPGTQKDTFNVPVTITKTGETNSIVVKVTAIDFSGNATPYEQKLAIDNEQPRVTVTYDNNSVLNNKYFKADRHLQIQITDLNFDETKTTITTQPGVRASFDAASHTYTAYADYTVDGDYTLSMQTTDKAMNPGPVDYTNGGRNAAPQEFTIDKTAPVITVAYDNNDVRNGKYYNADRIATVTILEHNFNGAEVQAPVTATLDGTGIAAPGISGFTGGDSHSAQIPFTADGDYSFTVNYTDLAGNPAVSLPPQEFTIDKTIPEAVIGNVQNGQAYSGEIQPSITFTDVNFDPNGYNVVWNVSKLGSTQTVPVESAGVTTTTGHGVVFTFNNLANTVSNDGIYTLSATITDMAGNSFETEPVQYSVNRFGSVYTANNSATEELLKNGFSNKPVALSIRETNPNKLTNITISLAVNGTTKNLVEGTDFTIQRFESDGAWKQYTYDIKDSAFLDANGNLIQGDYVITIYSEDEAGNKNSSRTNDEANKLNMEFIMDNEPASGYITIEGLSENNRRIQAAETGYTIYWEDNNAVSRIDIYLNGELVKTLEGEELAEANGQYTLNIQEANYEQSVYAVITDAAGNTRTLDEVTFFLNSSAFQQFLHNTGLLIGVIVGVVVVIALIIFLIARRKKSGEKTSEK